MGYIKRWLEDHIDEFTDEELRTMGMSDQTIENFRACGDDSREEHTPL